MSNEFPVDGVALDRLIKDVYLPFLWAHDVLIGIFDTPAGITELRCQPELPGKGISVYIDITDALPLPATKETADWIEALLEYAIVSCYHPNPEEG